MDESYSNIEYKEPKLIQNSSEFTFNKNNINYDNNNNNREINNRGNVQITTSIDDKYKNLENPFTNPEIPTKKVEDEEKRIKIMERINRGRKKVKSQSADSLNYKKSDNIQRKADILSGHLFKE